MTRGRYRAALIAGFVAPLGIAACTAAAATNHTAASHTAASHTASRPARGAAPPVALDCGRPEVRPSSFVLTCADAGDSLGKLSWSSWTSPFPTATGVEMVKDCIPYCAANGKFHSYPVNVVFWRREAFLHHHGQQYFSRVTLLYPGARPPIYQGGKSVPGPETRTFYLLDK